MKTQIVAIAARQYDPELENLINEKNNELNDQSKRKAELFAKRNQPEAEGDRLDHYVSEVKAGYEKLGAVIYHHLQPEAHFPEAKWDADYYKNKEAETEKEIQKKTCEKYTLQHVLGKFDPLIIRTRLWLAMLITGLIAIGDTVFIVNSFQVLGDNLLRALLLSMGVSVSFFVFSHFVPFRIKEAETIRRKRIILIVTMLIATVVYGATAMLRSTYLASKDVHISPVYFVIINLFLFIVSMLVSYYLLPTMPELKNNSQKMKQHKAICSKQNEIDKLVSEKKEIEKAGLENKKQRARIIYTANYALDIIRKMYKESIALFKSENLIHRTDGKVPQCFSDEIPEPDINQITVLKQQNKAS